MDIAKGVAAFARHDGLAELFGVDQVSRRALR
jgi:hypothetical protein